MKDVVLFTRQRGTSSETTEQEMLNVQIRKIEAYAERQQLRIVDRVALTGISAHELRQKMIAYLAEHLSVRAVITYSADRLFRDLDTASRLVDLLRKRSIRLFFADGATTMMTKKQRMFRRITVCQECGRRFAIEGYLASAQVRMVDRYTSFRCRSTLLNDAGK